ncbi:sugar-binding transcriptional regulator [Gemelliphila palaticanis]|uniref:Transcriptional regulator n=1 Tax=Gemelliphila palaticanis TaxID=81950 RepID=A0ABX2SZE9_9BACL|nr:sugar-binding domain-containing protein [Gemella palaticanis]MBF0714793.1 transcriptional regulator [Gemella palaticanis]NYS46723.1 transcriptional regulator [Gemella palaticanis]
MNILQMLRMQSRLIPDIVDKFNKRYELLLSIQIHQPIGRKSLIDIMSMTERQLRTECEILTKLGLINKNTTGMTITEDGQKFLADFKNYIVVDNFKLETEKIKNYFGLKKVLVVKGDFTKSDVTKKNMVNLLFDNINDILSKGSVIGVSGGSTMQYVASNVDKTFGYGKDIIISPIRGALTISNTGYQSNDIATQLAVNSNHKYQLLHAPDNIESSTLDELIKEPIVKQSLDIIAKTSVIIHSVGDAFEMAQRRKLPVDVISLLKENFAVSEAFGSYFDADGNVIYSTKTIGMSSSDVKNVANIFTIAGGCDKSEAIYSYLNSKPSNTTLIIDESICKKILNKLNKNIS